MDHREELYKQVNQLLRLLKRILKSGSASHALQWLDEGGKNITLNICLFNLIADDGEGVDGSEIRLEDILGDTADIDDLDETQPLTFELTRMDQEFLKSNGLTF